MTALKLKKQRYIDQAVGASLGFGTPDTWKVCAHYHDFHEFLLVIDGHMKHFLHGKPKIAVKGDMFFIRAHDVHCYRPARNAAFAIMNLAFTTALFNSVKSFLDNDPRLTCLVTNKTTPHRHLNGIELAELMSVLREIRSLIFQNKPRARIRLKLTIADILTKYFLLDETVITNAYIPDWLCRVCLEMKKEVNFIAGLPQMKKIACRSQEHLTRSCRKYLGKTPTEFINHLRLEYARVKLLTTDDTVTTVALDSGFHNFSHFLRLFRKTYGQSPARYRKKNKSLTAII